MVVNVVVVVALAVADEDHSGHGHGHGHGHVYGHDLLRLSRDHGETHGSGYGQVPDPLHVPVAQVLPAQQGWSGPPQATQL